MKTYQPKQKEIRRTWHEIDASGDTLGRVAVRVAQALMGKHKRTYSMHMDSGDNVVVMNAGALRVSGKKEEQKAYRSHSGYPGGFKEVSFKKLKAERPERLVEFAVRGMLPKNRLRKERMARLKIVRGVEHNYGDKKKK